MRDFNETPTLPPSGANAERRHSALARLSVLCALVLPLLACGGGGDSAQATPPVSDGPPPTKGDPPAPAPAPGPAPSPAPAPGPAPAPAPAPVPTTPPKATVLNSTLESPWSLAFLPDGRMLVTQKAGTMVILSADGKTKSEPLSGVPKVANAGQGGLLDVVLDPDFATTPWVYFSYAEPAQGGQAGTAVNRGRLVGSQLLDVSMTPIFRQSPKVSGEGHFGSRLVFRADKTLFVTLGERQKGSPAQDLTTHLGKVVRINRDGTVPEGNPDFGAGSKPELWSYGHRNPQGAAIHPTTGELWELEHGPQGGDELNIARAGGNYGWPNKSYGCDYGITSPNCQLGGGTHAPAYIEPVSHWPDASVPVPAPSIAPSGLAFYTGDKFPEWKGNIFLGALAGQALWRVVLNGNVEVSREKLFADLKERIRCVRQGPDGWLYLLTDSGKLIRIER